ncbi:MAG: hypothetical protein ACTSR2_01370 [Candidatus Hodarchaeales archaeon]
MSIWGLQESRDGIVQEGNVPVLIIPKDNPIKIRFLFADLSLDVMKEKVKKNDIWEQWVKPIPVWEHISRDGGGFSTVHCVGKGCALCQANAKKEAEGVKDNKLKPYPLRKRYIAPVWIYGRNIVAFIKQSEQYYSEVEQYIIKFGVNIDFETFRTGEGLQTKYKLIFLGKGEKLNVDVMKPKSVNLTPIEQRDFKEFAEEEEDTPLFGEGFGDIA